MSNQAPQVLRKATAVPASGSAVDVEEPVVECPFAGTVTAAVYTPNAAITGAATNSRTLTIFNRKGDGTGTLAVATLALVVGVNAAAETEKALTLSGTPANATFAQGDVLTFSSVHVGTGIADPGGQALVELTLS